MKTPTTAQIHALSAEAANHGDHMQVAICDRALGLAVGKDIALTDPERARAAAMSREEALSEVADVIADSEAQS